MFSNKKVFVICELSQTHEGDFDLAKDLVRKAAEAKADAAKVQVFSADELAVPEYKYYKIFKKSEWEEEKWRALVDYAHQQGIKMFADVFGTDSLEMLVRIGIDGLKLHGTDMRNIRLLKALSKLDLPLLLAIGGGTIAETKEALKILTSEIAAREIVLMHGFQSYPTLIEHTNLNKMRFFGDQLGLSVGFADHIDGDHPQRFSLCALAVGMGAVVIEKHITKDRKLKMQDYESALNPDDFIELVNRIRELDEAKGYYGDRMNDIEKNYRKDTRKHVVASRSIEAGQVIEERDVLLKRAVSEEEPSELEDIIGKKADKNYEEDFVLLKRDIH